MPQDDPPRIDKWLWAVRVFKTRSMATQACRAGKIKVEEQTVKPSRNVHPGMEITVQSGPVQRKFRVLALLDKRVGAKLVEQYMEDLTPEEEYQKLKMIKSRAGFGLLRKGRPTKKERRDLDEWFGWE